MMRFPQRASSSSGRSPSASASARASARATTCFAASLSPATVRRLGASTALESSCAVGSCASPSGQLSSSRYTSRCHDEEVGPTSVMGASGAPAADDDGVALAPAVAAAAAASAAEASGVAGSAASRRSKGSTSTLATIGKRLLNCSVRLVSHLIACRAAVSRCMCTSGTIVTRRPARRSVSKTGWLVARLPWCTSTMPSLCTRAVRAIAASRATRSFKRVELTWSKLWTSSLCSRTIQSVSPARASKRWPTAGRGGGRRGKTVAAAEAAVLAGGGSAAGCAGGGGASPPAAAPTPARATTAAAAWMAARWWMWKRCSSSCSASMASATSTASAGGSTPFSPAIARAPPCASCSGAAAPSARSPSPSLPSISTF